jgi:hypothetical protein
VPIPTVPEPVVPPIPLPDPLAAPGPDRVPNPFDSLAEPLADPVVDKSTDSTAEAEPAPTPNADQVDPSAPPAITTTTQSDGGNVNTSVRVNSTGTDEPVAQERDAPDVVSPAAQPDITTEPDTGTSAPDTPGVLAPDPAPGASPGASQSGPTNTNVSVRVLSPGDNGPVSQTNASTAPTGETKANGTTASSSTAQESPTPPPDSTQYQDQNSQYQSLSGPFDQTTSDRNVEPWNWTWTLTVCDGSATSISTETGGKESRDWVWDWAWNWTCESPTSSSDLPPVAAPDNGSVGASASQVRGSGEPQPGPANTNVSVRVLSPGDNGPVTQSNTSQAPAPPHDGASGEPPWIWTWTFTLCGTTIEISTLAGEETDLNWAWNWLWAWDCENSGGPAPTPADTGGDTASPVEPGPAADPPAAEPPAAPASGLPASVTQSGSDTTGAMVDLSVTPPSTLTEWVRRLPWAPAVADLPALHVPLFSSPTSATWGTLASWPTPLATPPIEVAVDVTIPSIVLSKPPSPAFPAVPMPTSGGAVQIVIEVGAPILPSSTALGPTGPDQAPGLDVRAPHGADPQPRGTSVRASWTHPTVQRSQPTADASAGSMPRPARGPLPFNLPRPLQAAGSSASTGGSVPSLLLFGFATLIGFFVLAAPGLERRIRLARLPSPRSRFDSPLDRPG